MGLRVRQQDGTVARREGHRVLWSVVGAKSWSGLKAVIEIVHRMAIGGRARAKSHRESMRATL